MSTNPEPRNLDHVIEAVRRSGAEIKEPVDTVEGLKRLSEQVDELEMSRKERKVLQAIVRAEQKYRELAESGKLTNDVEQVKSSPKWKKYLKWALIIAAVGGMAYLGYKYLPSWDEVMAWTQRLRGNSAALAANTGVGAPAVAAPPVTPKLVTGGITPTAPAGTGNAADLISEMGDNCAPIKSIPKNISNN